MTFGFKSKNCIVLVLLENGAEQFKDLIYEAMAAERPDLYKEVKKFIKSKAKEGKA